MTLLWCCCAGFIYCGLVMYRYQNERLSDIAGMQDVLVTLLNNLKVQERQNRVCTTVAIAIVAETCSPFTVLPALMNEYKVSLPTTPICRCIGLPP